MDIEEFKKKQVKACTSFPLYEFLQDDLKLYRKLSKRSEEDFGENLLGKYCAKREMCADKCLGRPIPKYPELENYLNKFENIEEGTYKGKEVYFFKVVLCNGCPFVDNCKSLCYTMEDYLVKDESGEEPYETRNIQYDDDIEYTEKVEFKGASKKKKEDIPWKVLSIEQTEVVKLRTLNLLTWLEISEHMGQEISYCRRLFQRAIKKLKRAAKAVEKNKEQLDESVKLFITEGLTVREIAEKQNLPERTVYNRLAKILNPANNQ